jgi:2-keto-4-pentenoate hydratase/2-oxohepta-3-ene-1,7-dioic acid hydratase in catechol pathway
MKLVTYDTGKTPRAGFGVDGMIADAERAAKALTGARLPASVRELIAGGTKTMGAAEKVYAKLMSLAKRVAAGKERRPAWLLSSDRVHLGPPMPDPEKIICLGMNYMDHCREQEALHGRKIEPPKTPVIFAKYPNTLTGPYDPIVLPPLSVSKQVDYEVELGVVIGRTAKGVKAKDAMGYVAGYMTINDVSARDCQFGDQQWVRGKSFDTFAPCGPWLTTGAEVGDPHRLKLWTLLNGRTMQSGTTRDLIHKLPAVIAFISQAITLRPGDILSTGTPAGVGIFRQPPVVLKPGDRVECGVERIGTISNPVERG